MTGKRRQNELARHRPYQALTFFGQPAKLPYLLYSHVGIANNIRIVIRKSLGLNIACGLHSCTDAFGWLPHSVPTKLFIVHPRNFNGAAPYQYDRAADRKYVFDTSSPGHERRYRLFVYPYRIHTGRDVHNWIYFSGSAEPRKTAYLAITLPGKWVNCL
jgi:hypothetical protein